MPSLSPLDDAGESSVGCAVLANGACPPGAATPNSANERDPGALVLVAFAHLGEDERVRAVGVRDQRRELAGERRLALAAADVRVAARRGELVVVALERAVA